LAGAEAMAAPGAPATASSALGTRVATGLVLAAAALAAVWAGGLAFAALAAAATLIMFTEWAVMQRLPRGLRIAGLALLGGIALLMALEPVGEVLMTLAAGAGLIGLFAARLRRSWGVWTAAGLLYCGLPLVALLWLRARPDGLKLTVFVLVAVWATDIAAYFAGRAIGGPKLAPAISPAKTWAGAFGGIIGAMLVGGSLAGAYLASVQGRGAGLFFGLAGALAVLAVLGDLYESWLKRRAGVKDSGRLLPGHGGVLDRLDGLVPVAIAGAGVFAATGWAG